MDAVDISNVSSHSVSSVRFLNVTTMDATLSGRYTFWQGHQKQVTSSEISHLGYPLQVTQLIWVRPTSSVFPRYMTLIQINRLSQERLKVEKHCRRRKTCRRTRTWRSLLLKCHKDSMVNP